MHLLFLFLDGVGLGPNDPATNPLAAAHLPTLEDLLGGRKMLLESAPYIGAKASLLALDATLGVSGFPQSATGQAVLVTGRNVPKEIGRHYGPKPNAAINEILISGNIFKTVEDAGLRAALLNAYPQGYFDGIESGKRMYSSIPMAVTSGGIALKDEADFFNGTGLAADFTGEGWRTHLGYTDSPVMAPHPAGAHMAKLAQGYHFSFFEFWASDYIGHYQDMDNALEMLKTFDQVLAGLLSAWDFSSGLILLTSDHGNLEDLSTKRHTKNHVPGLVIGSPELRQAFTYGLRDLTGVAPAILRHLGL